MLNWFYPPACMGCSTLIPLNDVRRAAIWLCASCEALLEPAEALLAPAEAPPRAAPNANPRHTPPTQVENLARYAYEGILRDIIRDVKFRRKKNHARALGRLWGDAIKNAPPSDAVHGYLPPVSVLAPVPLHPSKERERGFNQAGLLAAALSRAVALPVERALIRVVDTAPQAGLHPARRAENVADAFRVAPHCTPHGKSYILVDDIYTTGASLDECARTLLTHGAASVKAMTLTASRRPANR